MGRGEKLSAGGGGMVVGSNRPGAAFAQSAPAGRRGASRRLLRKRLPGVVVGRGPAAAPGSLGSRGEAGAARPQAVRLGLGSSGSVGEGAAARGVSRRFLAGARPLSPGSSRLAAGRVRRRCDAALGLPSPPWVGRAVLRLPGVGGVAV